MKHDLRKRLSGKTLKVYEHLINYDGITSMEAFKLYGATRLSAIIFNLRKYGCEIHNEYIEEKDRYGHYCRFVRYVLIGESV